MKMHLIIKNFLAVLLLNAVYAHGQGLINNAGKIVANGNVSIVVNDGGFSNSGQFIKDSSTLSFTGTCSTTNSFIGGSSSTDLYNLTLNKSVNGLRLNSNISVSNAINFISGDSIFLNNNIIDLGTTGYLSGERNSSRITGRTGGYVQVTAVLNNPSSANPGNIGLAITSAANMGNTVIKRGHQQQGGNSIYRYYNISPVLNTGLNASLQFSYFHAELGSIAENNLVHYSSTDNGINWVLKGKMSADVNLDYVTMNAYNILQIVTLGDAFIALPIRSVSLSVVAENNLDKLSWIVSSDQPVAYCTIEKSTDGRSFNPIGKISGKEGFTNTYCYTDTLAAIVNAYYRVKAVDLNNKSTYSNIVVARNLVLQKGILSLYPNPASDFITITITASEPGTSTLLLFDQSGKHYMQIPVKLVSGINNFVIPVAALKTGIYRLSVSIDRVVNAISFIKL